MSTFETLNSLLDNFSSYDPFKISEQKGIKVIIEPLGKMYGYYCTARGSQFIHISNSLCEEEKKFICAHELGHALLHPGICSFYTLFPIGRYERQANEFAVNLLLIEVKKEYPEYDWFQLARIAGIPRWALEAAFDHIIVA